MKKRLPVGLVVEGNLTKSVVLRLPHLAQELGPIKATSLRVARRTSNFLQAGFAVASYKDLQSSRLVLVRAPDKALRRIVDELCTSQLTFKSLAFAFCETWLSSDQLSELAERGASVATAIPVGGMHRRWFVVEGHPHAVKQVRRLLDTGGAGVLQLRGHSKHLYFAAETLTTAIPAPLYWMAQQSLREAGLSGNHLQALLEELMQKMLRDFMRGSHSAWTGPLLDCPPEVVNIYFQSLRQTSPKIAGVLARYLGSAEASASNRIGRGT